MLVSGRKPIRALKPLVAAVVVGENNTVIRVLVVEKNTIISSPMVTVTPCEEYHTVGRLLHFSPWPIPNGAAGGNDFSFAIRGRLGLSVDMAVVALEVKDVKYGLWVGVVCCLSTASVGPLSYGCGSFQE